MCGACVAFLEKFGAEWSNNAEADDGAKYEITNDDAHGDESNRGAHLNNGFGDDHEDDDTGGDGDDDTNDDYEVVRSVA